MAPWWRPVAITDFEPPRRPVQWQKPAAIGAAILFSVAIFVAGAMVGGGERAPEKPPLGWRDRDDWSGAYSATQKAVTERLKSPATADFPWFPVKHGVNLQTQTYYIESYVDSQNGFGALLRTKYAAMLEQTDDGVWEIKDLALE